jgi:hypothetical protein
LVNTRDGLVAGQSLESQVVDVDPDRASITGKTIIIVVIITTI